MVKMDDIDYAMEKIIAGGQKLEQKTNGKK
jgi:hypothetical protein